MAQHEDLVVAGLRVMAADPDADTTDWLYLPESASIASQPSGDLAMSLVDVGDVALLTVVGRLVAHESQVQQARDAIAGTVGRPAAAITLRPAPLTDVRATLLLDTDAGAVELADSSTSGAYPFDAAFHVTLGSDQAAAVRGAFAGGRGALTLRYTAALHRAEIAAPQVWSLTRASSSSSSTTVTTTSRSGGETTTETSGSGHDHAEELADLPVLHPPEPVTIDLDAADWTRPQP